MIFDVDPKVPGRHRSNVAIGNPRPAYTHVNRPVYKCKQENTLNGLVLKARKSIITAKITLSLVDMAMAVGLDTIERVRVVGSKIAQELDKALAAKPEWTGNH